MDGELNLLFPLDQFYERAALPLPLVNRVPGSHVPEPYSQLLVGSHDMTPTLEAFHGGRIEIRVIERRIETDSLARVVVLLLEDSGKPVEFGAIIIHLEHFPPEARERILEGHSPLGTILATYHVDHVSCPKAFIHIESDAMMEEALCLSGRHKLYGRRNVLLTPRNELLADIIEVLPP
jgi:chorismate-pyruvate lyase